MKVSIEMNNNGDMEAMEQIKKAFMACDEVFLKVYDHEIALSFMPELRENTELDGTMKMHCELST